jgi:UDP-N-acetylmuramate--alanine ligase
MHIYFSGIGGAGIGPLAQIAFQAGYQVSGSDKQASSYIDYLKTKGINNIVIGQSKKDILNIHKQQPIDWLVYSSALTLENPDPDELRFARDNNIKISKRDQLINQILIDNDLKLIAIAGTHGKTTTTAMVTWLFKQNAIPISYLLPAKTTFADMGEFNPNSQYFVYEADEFDNNFLAFSPAVSLISGVSWDHHEFFPTRDAYKAAFTKFIKQSNKTFLWPEDASYLNLTKNHSLEILNDNQTKQISLKGYYNRRDGLLAIKAVKSLTNFADNQLIKQINGFPGLSRRMEEIIPGLYSDYAHTPEKIMAAINTALEISGGKKRLVIVYEPLTDRRQHYIKQDYGQVFDGVSKIYWLPSYLAREDKNSQILNPKDLIKYLAEPTIAEPKSKNQALKQLIKKHLKANDMVIAIAGGGGGSLDDWLRHEFN